MLKKLLVVLLLSVCVANAQIVGDCKQHFRVLLPAAFSTDTVKVYETDNLKITYQNPFDLALAIPAVKKARDFFTKLGYKSDYPVDITFKEEVRRSDCEKTGRVYAIYDGRNQKITISSWGTDYVKNRKCFGMPSNVKIHASIVSHEVAHSLLKSIAGKRGHGINEYVAYTVQFSTMDADMRKKILDFNSDVGPHEPDDYGVPRGINSFAHGMNAHDFGIMSYLHFVKYGPQIFHDIIKGIFDPDQEMEALVLGGQRLLRLTKSMMIK